MNKINKHSRHFINEQKERAHTVRNRLEEIGRELDNGEIISLAVEVTNQFIYFKEAIELAEKRGKR